MGFESEENAAALLEACRRDILFFVNAFCWVYEARSDGTRESKEKCLPFLTWDFQEDAILSLKSAILEGRDLLIEKSRDMGASWMCLIVFLWLWMFERDCALMVMSRVADLVDKPGNPDCLFAKILYVLDRLPGWMRPKYRRTSMHLLNEENGSVIDGEATGPDSGRGGRRMAVLLDEFAMVDKKEKGLGNSILSATRNNTNCRIFNSTPKGTDTAFYLMRESGIEKLSLHWSMHPHKRKGLYRVNRNEEIEILDPSYSFPENYNFIKEPGGWKGLRSPYYDKQCERTHSRVEIAQEEDIDYLGGGDPFFDPQDVGRVLVEHCIAPMSMKWLHEALGDEFLLMPGKIKHWVPLDQNMRPPQDTTYSFGIDISTGTGASDSTIVIVNNMTGEKAAEYCCNTILPEDLAKVCVRLAELYTTPLGYAFLVWDGYGPGSAFGRRIVEIHGYKNVYYHVNDQDRKARPRSAPGCPLEKSVKLNLFTNYRAALFSGLFVNRSSSSVHQLEEYVYDDAGGVRHARRDNKQEASGNKQNHGDLVIADVLAWRGVEKRPLDLKPEFEIPKECLAARMAEAEMARARREEDWF